MRFALSCVLPMLWLTPVSCSSGSGVDTPKSDDDDSEGGGWNEDGTGEGTEDDTGEDDGPQPTDEDCDDGVDNDLDGLIDCEDGDCFEQGLCGELCDDGEDNDDNGAIDCADEGCWGESGCPILRTQVLNGSMTARTDASASGTAVMRLNMSIVYYRKYDYSMVDSSPTYVGGTGRGLAMGQGQLSGLSGTMSVISGDLLHSCVWNLDSWSFYGTASGSEINTLWAGDPQGFQTSGGCGGLSEARALPSPLSFQLSAMTVRARSGWNSGRSFVQLSALDTSTQVFSTYQMTSWRTTGKRSNSGSWGWQSHYFIYETYEWEWWQSQVWDLELGSGDILELPLH